MQIYTSYFSNVKKLPTYILPISIANITPNGWKYPIYQKLAPSDKLLRNWKQTHDNLDYIFDYEDEILNNYKISDIIK